MRQTTDFKDEEQRGHVFVVPVQEFRRSSGSESSVQCVKRETYRLSSLIIPDRQLQYLWYFMALMGYA
jgi:hypothetical protein